MQCFHPWYTTWYVSIQHNFAYIPYLGFTKSCQNSYIDILLNSGIESPKYAGLLTSISVFFHFCC